MAKIRIDRELLKKIYEKKHINLEARTYTLDPEIKLESPCSIAGVNLHMPFKLGAFSHINGRGCLIQNATIGRYCAIATNVKIGNGEHPTNWLSINSCQFVKNFRKYEQILEKPIQIKEFQPYNHTFIGNDVWIGTNVFIKDGVTIGDGAIIGANSAVTKNVEPYAIVGGAPAKLIRYRFKPEIIEKLQKLKWWEYDISEFGSVDFDDIEKAIEQLEQKLPGLKKYEPEVVDYEYLTNIKVKKFFRMKFYKNI